MKIDSFINPKSNIYTNNFKSMSQQKENHTLTFRAFEPFMTMPLDTAKSYFSPLITQGYREIDTYKVPDVKESKLYELSNGHKVLVFQKNGPMVINTSVKTDDRLYNPVRHLVEHLIFKGKNQIGTKYFHELERNLALKTAAESSPFSSNYSIKYSFDDKSDIEKVINAQAQLLLSTDVKKYFEEEKNILIAESILKQAEKDENPKQKKNLLNLLQNSSKAIKEITIEDTQSYYDQYYKNSNMVTVISSEMKPDEMIKLAAKYFRKQNEPKYEQSRIKEKNVNPKDTFLEYLSSLNNKTTTTQDYTNQKSQAQKSLICLKNAKNLTEISAKDIIKYGKPIILKYPELLTKNIGLKELSNNPTPSFGMSKNKLDVSSIKEYKYPNNLSLVIDTAKNSDVTALHYMLKTDKPIVSKQGANEILSCMMALTLNKNPDSTNHIITDNSFASENCLKINTICLPDYTLQTIQDSQNAIFNPDLTKENFDTALKLTKQRFLENQQQSNLKKQEIMQDDEYKLTGCIPLYTPIDAAMNNYDKITLDDIKQIHSQFLNNTKGEALIVLPESIFENSKEKIFGTIGGKIPLLRQSITSDFRTQPIEITKPETNIVIKELTNSDNARICLDYKLPITNDLKEKVGLKILETIIGGENYSRLFSQLRERDNLVYNANSLLKNHETYTNFTLISDVPINNGKYENLQKICNCFKENIDDLKNKPVDNQELDSAKLTIKNYLSDSQESCATRYSKINEFGTAGLQNIYTVINNITSQDIQKLATKYLKNSVWSLRATKEAYESNAEYLKKLENNN